MPRWSMSSWSVHRWLGEPFHAFADDAMTAHARQRGEDPSQTLLTLPTRLRDLGVGTLELCHFHLPSIDDGYLARFRAALDEARVELYSVLIDRGDITAEDERQREQDLRVIRRYIEIAAQLGARRVRIDGGRSEPTAEAIDRSARHLRELAAYAERVDIGVITENWHATTRAAGPLLEILGRCAGRVELCCDLGNAEGPDKYATLAAILPHATSMHCKARYDEAGVIDRDDLARCLRLAAEAGFDGPISLINGPDRDEWRGVAVLRDAVAAALAEVASSAGRS